VGGEVGWWGQRSSESEEYDNGEEVDHCDYCEREFALCVSTAFLSLMEVGDIWDENCASQAGVKTGEELWMREAR
jgi:hypothetical protein